ncbi:ABC transporter substrate-binding protein [uncultured Nocardioides sp.]|uniref:ABC transporter substrate-binding protein n=1 Tax=uncultured Nocardioides sp. TaxID=198441 RepID=UPI001AC97E09|nr:ABC transporter substrate-binding protein [uncultured Nocardioides sp.]GIM65184.1 ABC transporter substrate-binding protein [Planomonospora venezuelensis]
MRLTATRRRTAFAATAAALALTTTGCLGSDDDGGGGGESGGDDGVVEILATTDPLVFDGLKAKVEEEAEAAGIEVNMERVDNINQLILTRIQAGDPPDIAVIPQPGVIKQIVDRGEGVELTDDIVPADLIADMTPGTLEAGQIDGTQYGLMISMNVKSLVFYNKQAWEEAGYEAPETLDDLAALTEQIKSDGGTPWCFGIESGAATGWPATDWFEDLIMRYGGADVYNQWVTNEVKFDSDVVRQAADYLETNVLAEGNVPGGRSSIASVAFGDAEDTMWEDEPGCWMFKQGNFVVSADFMPQDVVDNVDERIGVFGFPPAEAGGENPVLGGGDLATLLEDNDDSRAIMEILADVELGTTAAPESSFISPHTEFDTSLYPSDLTRQIADVAYQADPFLFDGSDQMPGEVGAGSFWKEMTAWISEQQDLDTTLTNIDDSWPSS